MTEGIHEEWGRQHLDDAHYEPPYCDNCGGTHDEADCDDRIDALDDDQYTGPTFREDDS